MAALLDQLARWAWKRSLRMRGRNPWLLAVQTLRSATGHRLTGHAAEMAFFAAVTLVPSTVAVGAALGLVQRAVGLQSARQLQDTAIGIIRTLLGPGVTDQVVAPFVRAQLAPAHGGVALGSLLIAWWLSGNLFNATAHALDRAYGVTDRPATWRRRVVALSFGLGSVAVVSATLALAVVGPFWARWPLSAAILVAFLLCLYRFCPNLSHGWRACLPGAVLAVPLLVLSTAGFRAYLVAAPHAAAIVDEPAVAATAAAVNAVVATVLWTYISAVAVLLGGELNAQVEATSPHRPTKSASRSP